MQFSPFVHLHNHSDFSILSASTSVKAMLNRVAEMRQPAVALTDYSNLFGAIAFYSDAMRMGIKPILGCEFFLCDDYLKKSNDGGGRRGPEYAQIVLLARNNQGWKNLLKLSSIGYLEGFYYKPRIDHTLLKAHSSGLIALSSGWNGTIEKALRAGNKAEAYNMARLYRDMFAEHCFFIELQRYSAAHDELDRQLVALAHELDIPLVASNNSHFLSRDDFQGFKSMLALRDNRHVEAVETHFTDQAYLKSHEQMEKLFEDVPEALENTLHIANRCNVDLQFGNYQLPDFASPEGVGLAQYLKNLSYEGLREHWDAILFGTPSAKERDYHARLDFELDVIASMGFPGYFLIVADFIQWAKKHDIPVGPGRGSGAGSLVAYSLGITDLDPIKYGLLFERFLNPERVSMPDFDVDFCMNRRGEVIDYVVDKYGKDRVAQIITYGSMKAKAVVRDMGRVLGVELAKVNSVAKLIPNDLKMTLDKAEVAEPRLADLIEEDAEVARLFALAKTLEGRNRSVGTHAAGVIIGREALVESTPLFKMPGEEGQIVQWDMGNSEKTGLIKFDFLGLKTLTVIHKACVLLREDARRNGTEHVDFDIAKIPLDDAKTFALYQQGKTNAVFQVESSGMRDLLVRLRPDCFEDIIALVALYRPGPLESGMVDTYIECKHGKAIEYPLPQLKSILGETNGVILYQEQVMQIAQLLAGYSLGQADMLRRAMGKKKAEEMAEQRAIFMEGSIKLKVPADKAEHIFDLMEKFAGYGFNKSHSAAYALISYQTAYLKAHFPQAFMAATLSCDMGNQEKKIAPMVADCRSMGLEILPPDINASYWDFVPEGAAIRYGLGAVKGVGQAAIECMTEVRDADGPFADFEDLVMRLPERTLNKRICESLIKSGAMHAMVPHIRAGVEGIVDALEVAVKSKREQASNQSMLFGGFAAQEEGRILFPDLEPYSFGEALQIEKEVLGFYLTGHPLEGFLTAVHGLGDINLSMLPDQDDGARVVLPVSVSSVREHRGGRGCIAFLQLDDLHGSCEMVVFPKMYEQFRELIQGERPLLVAARVDASREESTLVALHMQPLEEVLPQLIARVRIHCSALACDATTVAELKLWSERDVGDVALQFYVRLVNGSIAHLDSSLRFAWSDALKHWLEGRFGEKAIEIYCKAWDVPEPPKKTRGQYGE
ncbi:MAG: DNA polymerase III subunit alpha [Zetaproteobacteria bacterium]|nr:DNA polymerase III subunit alpha [Zetaproteobacteria bacterium]